MPPAPAGLAARVSGGRGRSTSGPPYSRPSSRPSAPPSRPPGAACLRQVQARPFAGAGASVLKRALLRVKRQAPELRKGFLESGGPSLDGESSQGSTNHCVLGNTCVPPFQVKWASFILSIKRELSEPADSVRGIALGAAGTMIHRVKNEPSPWDGCSLVGEKANLLQTALCSCVPHRPASLSGSGDGHGGTGGPQAAHTLITPVGGPRPVGPPGAPAQQGVCLGSVYQLQGLEWMQRAAQMKEEICSVALAPQPCFQPKAF